MPIKVLLKTIPFKDEDGSQTDASFTIRTRLSHRGRNEYMKVLTAEVPDLREAIDPETGKAKVGYQPKIGIGVIDAMERILLEYGLVGLQNVEDATGKPITEWEEFLSHESFYVTQVVKALQEVASKAVEKAAPDPNASAPSVAP